jgi:Zn-dependent protease with chaperone function
MEAEADWVALETTREPAAATSLFQGFSQEALLDPSPPTWAFVLMENHPSIAERVAMVEAWQARGGR